MNKILQKFIADSGLCSRRQAEGLIRAGRIQVNGYPAELGQKVSESDKVLIDGRPVGLAGEKIYIKLNKPKGYTCTNRNFKGEKNIFSLLPARERLFVVGRLDKDSQGLVFLTNDGELAYLLTHPRFAHEKEYEVKVRETKINEKQVIAQLRKGVDIGEGDGVVRVKEINYLPAGYFRLILTTGKKRQIKRMFKVAGLGVISLKRVRISNLYLDKLLEGKWEYLSKEEIGKLKNN